MVTKFGPVEELFIYYHPTTNKHLGLGRVVFESVKSSKACVEKLNGTSVMGKVNSFLNVLENMSYFSNFYNSTHLFYKI